jgi:hypothetical protein
MSHFLKASPKAIRTIPSTCPFRALLALAAWLAGGAFVQAAAQPASDVGPGYDIEMSRMIPVRDGE